MKNRKGFTLIELLAVIVILAIIAIIAMPIILNVIETARKGSKESSALGYVDAVEKQVMMAQVDSGASKIPAGIYSVEQLTTLKVDIKGEIPGNTGIVKINNKGQVTEGWFTYDNGKYKVYYDGSKAVANTEKYLDSKGNEHNDIPEAGVIKTYGVGEAVYLDPTNLSNACDASNSVSTPGTKTGCMKWYIIKNNGSSVNLILDHNTTATVAWNSTENNASMNEVATQLATDTQGWSGSPRLITANEVAAITGNAGWDSATATADQYFYFGSNNTTEYSSQTEEQKARQRSYAWLFDYISECTTYGCDIADSSTYGYWTSTPLANYAYDAWFVDHGGSVINDAVNNSDSYGIRPVITINKSYLN